MLLINISCFSYGMGGGSRHIGATQSEMQKSITGAVFNMDISLYKIRMLQSYMCHIEMVIYVGIVFLLHIAMCVTVFLTLGAPQNDIQWCYW